MVLLNQQFPVIRLQMVTDGATADSLIVMLQIWVAATGRQVADATTPETHRTTNVLRGSDKGCPPPECDRLHSCHGNLNCQYAQWNEDQSFQQLPTGRQEFGTFLTDIPWHGTVNAIVRPAELHSWLGGGRLAAAAAATAGDVKAV